MSDWLPKLAPFKSLFKKKEDPNHEWEELARWKKEWTCWAKDKAQLQKDRAGGAEEIARLYLDYAIERKLQACRLQEDWANWEKDRACHQESVTRLYEERTCLDESFARYNKERANEYGKVTNVHWEMAPWNFAENDSEEGRKLRVRELEAKTDLQKLFDQPKGLNHLENELNDRQCSLKKRRDELEERQLILTFPTYKFKDDHSAYAYSDTWIKHQPILYDRVLQLNESNKQFDKHVAKSNALRLQLLRDPVALPYLKLIRFLQKTVEKAKIVKTPNHPESYFPVMVAVLDFLQSFFTVEML
jgi:hypothetical protein